MICSKSKENISLISKTLKDGSVVILPTDTVYGFSALVKEGLETDRKIRRIKGRSETKPFIQLIASPQDLKIYTDDIIPRKLLKFWPGPLTIIAKDKRLGGKTTAFRCPGDEWLRTLIQECGFPIYSTSANRSGSPVINSEKELIAEFEKEVALIVLDGDVKEGLPSTLVKIEDGEIVVLRQGAVKVN